MKAEEKQAAVRRRLLTLFFCGIACSGASVWAQCNQPTNPVVAENCLTGNPNTEWDTSGSGDPSIQGFATDISVNIGQSVYFKIKTDAASYRLDIYRMGYYGGMGARKVVTVNPSVPLPQAQPACLTDAATKLLDCGNWAVSASWAIPSNAVSGIYFAHLVRADTGGNSHIFFIVRNDASHSNVLYQTSDLTWQAYNNYGGFSIYGDSASNLPVRAYKVSYNRPFNTRGFEYNTWLFNAEYPMVRWLEANGYDVSYFTGVDAARYPQLIANHNVYLSSGHDEYWDGTQRVNVQAARDAGVNLAFFSGNEVFWKTRWENSVDGSNTPYRTLVCYKETLIGTSGGGVTDPADPPTWTGTWRDPRFSPPADGGRPENALTGTLFMVNGVGPDNNNDLSIQVPAADGKMRFWRNTSVASLTSGQVAVLPPGTLGYEWDSDFDNSFRPAGLIDMSTATYSLTTDLLLDYGAIYGAGTATHHLTLYRAPSGALVFGAGTVQWAWGLDGSHDGPSSQPDIRMQQATVNLFADMGAQPGTLQPGLLPATESTDTVAPSSSITSPASGATVTTGSPVTVSGTSTDAGGGVVGAVEVSVDGGQTWHPANGRGSWTFSWVPGDVGQVTINSRAVDDSGNIEQPSAGSSITVMTNACPCTTWTSSTVPAKIDSGDANSIEVGVKFHADYAGYITGIRFYKSAANTGTHIGHLWSSTGALLGSAIFTNETSSGWQQVNFANPIGVTANATYTASYFAPAGHYSASTNYFATTPVDDPPIHYPSGSNGVYAYGSNGTFPASTFVSTNYWVDVVYIPAASIPFSEPALFALPSSLNFSGYVGLASPPAQNVSVYDQSTGAFTWTANANVPWIVLSPVSGSTPANLSISVNLTGLASGSYSGVVTVTPSAGGGSPQTIAVALTLANVLLSSDFNGGNAEGWVVSPLGHAPDWSVVNNAVQYDGGGHTQLYTGNSAWTDYSFQADVKLATLNDFPGGIRGRVNPTTGASYAVWFYPTEQLIKLYKTVTWNIDAGYTQLGQATVRFDTQKYHTVTLSFQGGQIQVSYDGNLLITATDSSYTSGMIAFDVSNQVINFDNALVSASSTSSVAVIASPTSLSFTGNYASANPAAQSLQLSASGAGILTWTAVSTAPWLGASPASGITPATLQIAVNTSGLAPGSYNGTLRVTSPAAGNSPQLVNVALTVNPLPPSIVLSPPGMNFTAVIGQASPAPQTLTIGDGAGFGSFAWTAATDVAWLNLSPTSGSTPSNVTINVNTNGLAPGHYSGNIIVSASGVGNSPQSIPVSLGVLNQAMTETFGNAAAGWIISPMKNGSGWSVANSTYNYSGLGLSQSCAGNASWTDYNFDTNIKLSNLNNYPGGVRGRVNPATGAGYAVWLYPGSNTIILYKVSQWDINAGLAVLAQAPLTFDATAYHDLNLVFWGSQISVYWDGNFLMTATDSTYSAGYVCMDANNQPISYENVRVAASQNAATLSATPASLTFSSAGGSVPAPQTVAIGTGTAATTWAITTSGAWLTAAASSAITPANMTVTANPTGLAKGIYNGSVTVFAPGATNSPLVITVTLAVSNAVLSTAPASLTFFGATDVNPQSQNISITNTGTGSLTWTAANDVSWISLGATSGTAPSSLVVSANATSLPVGQYSGNVTISSGDVYSGPAKIPVSLQVGTSLFTDNFSSGSAANWTASPLGNAAGWSVVNNAFQYNGGGLTQQYAGSSSWTNYTAAVDFTLSSLNDYPGGLRGRVNTSTGASYGVWVYPAQGLLKLYRIGQWNIDADFTLLATSGSISIDTTNWHNLRLSFNGSQIQVYYDNALAIQANDSSYSQGAIALDVSNQPIAFTNVKVIGF
jgi:hypothetical protein